MKHSQFAVCFPVLCKLLLKSDYLCVICSVLVCTEMEGHPHGKHSRCSAVGSGHCWILTGGGHSPSFCHCMRCSISLHGKKDIIVANKDLVANKGSLLFFQAVNVAVQHHQCMEEMGNGCNAGRTSKDSMHALMTREARRHRGLTFKCKFLMKYSL